MLRGRPVPVRPVGKFYDCPCKGQEPGSGDRHESVGMDVAKKESPGLLED